MNRLLCRLRGHKWYLVRFHQPVRVCLRCGRQA